MAHRIEIDTNAKIKALEKSDSFRRKKSTRWSATISIFTAERLREGAAKRVDLTQDSFSFMELFRLIGRNLPLEVIYKRNAT